MTPLRTVEEVAYDLLVPFECEDNYLLKTEAARVLEKDRLAISTALVEALKQCKPKVKSQDFSLQGIYNEGYNQALAEAQTIIKQLLESKN